MKIKRITKQEAQEAVAKMSKKQINDLLKEDKEYEKSFNGAKKIIRGAVIERHKKESPEKEFPKEKINIRFDYDVACALRSLGPGWSTEVNNTMRKFLVRKGLLKK